jgi:hypothetical protein
MDLSGAISSFKKPQTTAAMEVDLPSITTVFKPFMESEVQKLKDIQANARAGMKRAVAKRDRRAALRWTESYQKSQRSMTLLRSRWGDVGDVLHGMGGIDRYLTGLSSIEGYTKIWGEQHPDVPFRIPDLPYIMALTTPVEITHNWQSDHLATRDMRSQGTVTYDLGVYRVMIPLGGATGDIHWIPLRDPVTELRHPHHVFRSYSREAATCWGSYQDYVVRLVSDGEFIPLLRLCSKFAHDYNQNSPLTHVGTIRHKIQK